MDPFEDAMSSVESSLARSRQRYSTIRNSGYVKEAEVIALSNELSSAHEELEILLDVMTTLRSSNGRVGGGNNKIALPASVLVSRQRHVTVAEDEYKDLTRGLEKLERGLADHKRQVAAAAAIASAQEQREFGQGVVPGHSGAASATSGRGGRAREGDVDFFNMQMETQQEEMVVQDAALDRLHHNVITMKQQAVEARDEMIQQDESLQKLHTVSDMLLSRVSVANQKVDVMLNSMSNKGKICLIVMLCLVLGIMIAVEFF